MTEGLHLAIALDGAGWHPAAWRAPDARPTELFRGRYWRDLVKQAEWGGIDFVTIEDALGLQTSDFGEPRVDPSEVQGRLDALLIASSVAPSTRRIGLVPTVTTTHTEPFHVSTAIATLDHISGGRAGWRPQVSGRPHEAAHFGRRVIPPFDPANQDAASAEVLQSLFDEAADSVEVVRALWDSWQDDAEIRDVATGRFIDRTRLHRVAFRGDQFSVLGPSITPRSPQGQPLVTVLAHQTVPYRLAAAQADIVYITPHDDAQVTSIIGEVRAAEEYVNRAGEPLRIWADLIIALDSGTQSGWTRLTELNELHGHTLRSDATILAGSAREIADHLAAWRGLGIDGFRLRPLTLPRDLVLITDDLVPLLASRGLLATDDDATTLRGRLGLPPARNRYVDEPSGALVSAS